MPDLVIGLLVDSLLLTVIFEQKKTKTKKNRNET